MPRGGKGGTRGGKNKKKGKGVDNSKRELEYKDDGQEYAKILKLLGGCRMEVYCFDGKKRLAKVRGKFKRRVWMNIGDIILVDLRTDYDDDKCDIVHKYWPDEAKALKNAGEIPDNVEIQENNTEKPDIDIQFSDNDDSEEETDKKVKAVNPEDFYDDSDSEDSDEDDETKNANFFNKQKVAQIDDSSEEEDDELADI